MINRALFLAFLICIPLSIDCQDTIYLDKNNNKTDKDSAFYFQIRHMDYSNQGRFIVEKFLANGAKCDSQLYIDSTENDLIEAYSWYSNGQIKSRKKFKNGILNDTLKTYWENGQVKREDMFRNGKFIKGNCYDMNGRKIPHFDFEIMPAYPGGDEELFNDIFNILIMPEIVKTKSLTVKVIARFVVDIDGYIKNIEITEGSYPEVNNEAIRTLSSLKKWQPGLVDGEPVKVWYTVPITFSVVNYR